ncbi:HsdM family class I SAM-dependent methyltransferase [Desulfuribacillus alkaliarsenatis]|uniref:site-specific DNA-methyltransferase (adenine-specific) n=1 Tax=Desulfuribacillus alkaliarsenatis TaxID=766136 RepID=A0A1E5G3Y6_9FIRM|nr:N-6 DNA methylase [Desulfuribacillus alkaliarsenatis]OEF97778.1 N-6 DNA methylase [Desulfuribacillus alkaliarsenatis]
MIKHQLPIETVISRLGYDDSDNLHRYKDFYRLNLSTHLIKILTEIKPYAAYFIDNKPFIIFFDTAYREISFKKISKKVWNSQIPIAFFCDENSVQVYNGTSLNLSSYVINKVAELEIDECSEYSDFSYWEITKSDFWTKYLTEYSKTKLNEHLLSNISFLTNKLKNDYNIKFATKLVLRLIFIRYLIDRGVDLAYGNFSNDIVSSQKELLTIIQEKEMLYSLFSHLKSKFNGNLFDLDNELNSPELTEEVFQLLSEFLSGTVTMNDNQLSFFALYDFNIIPVELISSIYEILLGEEVQAKDNAFYTPNYLVEYILDKTVLAFLRKNYKYKVLDPACGSGLFLVDSYRRIIEENLGRNVYCEDDTFLKKLLTENIYGIDINEEAIDVTIFSLYLTVLDYKDPKTLSQFSLPNLKGVNLIVSDFFDENKLLKMSEIKFDFILGNPPWGNVKNGLHIEYCKKRGYEDKQQNNEISRSFVFRARDFCDENTVCCLILHSKLLYNQKLPARNFRRFLLEETKIKNIIEMSSVRKLVFENTKAPAAIVAFKYNNDNNLKNKIEYTSLKPNIFFKLFNVIVIEKHDVKYIAQSLLREYDWAWKTVVYGFVGDFNTILNLKKRFNTIEDSIREQNPSMYVGAGVEYQDGDKLDARHLFGRKLLDSKKGVDHFFVNSKKTSIFSKTHIHRPREKDLFNPPYVLIPKGVSCDNFKLRAAYSDESFVSKTTMYIIKGIKEQKSFMLNLVGLINSSLYSYLNIMLGTSIGIEREQRFMKEVLSFPYYYSYEISNKVEHIQKIRFENQFLSTTDLNQEIEELDALILSVFGLKDNKFIDYAINVQIPELTKSKEVNVYKKVSSGEMITYSKCFEEQFSKIYNRLGKYISINLYPNILNKFSVFELSILDSKPEQKLQILNTYDANKEILTRFCVFKHNDVFHQLRDVIHFDENSFFIIKPNYSKNWHPAIAELDLADAIDKIMSDSGGEESWEAL